MPTVISLPDDAAPERIAEAVYDIHIKAGILFAPHRRLPRMNRVTTSTIPARAKDTAGKRTPFDFPQSGTRELTASDYVYAIRRLATTRIKSPSFSPLSEHILGLKAYGERIAAIDKELRKTVAPTDRDLPFLDFRQYDIPVRRRSISTRCGSD